MVRNRLRRRLRAILHALPLRPGYDLVVTPLPAAASASFHELTQALAMVTTRAHLSATTYDPGGRPSNEESL